MRKFSFERKKEIFRGNGIFGEEFNFIMRDFYVLSPTAKKTNIKICDKLTKESIMKDFSQFKFEFTDVECGWLDLKISIGYITFSYSFSNCAKIRR